MDDGAWPELPYAAWQATLDTLHLYLQVIGKIKLVSAPAEPEWGHAALYLSARGLTTGPMPHGNVAFQIDLDFVEHELAVSTSTGRTAQFALVPRTVAAFYAETMAALASAGVPVEINTLPQELPNPIPFPEDTTHASYDALWVNRFWRVLSSVDAAFKKFRAPYRGRHTPVNFWWGSCDLSYSRFSGRPAPPPPNSGLIMRLSMDAEEIAAGFWPGDGRYPAPAFYSYTYPKPAAIESAVIAPAGAGWNAALGEFLLPYETVRTAPSPEAALQEFLESTYAVGKKLGNWP